MRSRMFSQLLILLPLAVLLQSCFLLGIHKTMPNPDKAGKLPHFSEEEIMLGELNTLRAGYDVHFYDLTVAVNPEQEQLSGTVALHAVALQAMDSFQIDLDQPLAVTAITDLTTGQSLPYSRHLRAIYVRRSLAAQESFAISVSYSGSPVKAKKAPWKGGFVWKKDDQKKPWIGVACESEGASIWWPCKDHTSDEPDSMRLHYTVPKELVAVGNGTLTGTTTDASGASVTYHWKVAKPINTYNVSIYVGDFRLVQKEYTGYTGRTLLQSYYVLPAHESVALEHFKQADSVLYSFEQHFGVYPWYEDGFKLIESPYEGMEHQSAIAYGNGFKNDIFHRFDYIILHETGHEWWGNAITAADMADVWIQEGFTTYAEYVYMEDTDCKNCANSTLNFYRMVIKNKYPVVGVRDRRWFHFKKNADVYPKGAWILHTLRNQLRNDDLFFDMLQTFYATYKYQTVTSQDFIDVVNAKSGRNFDWYFQQYLYRNQVPEFHYHVANGYLYYHWEKVPEDFNQLEVTFLVNDEPVHIKPTTQSQSYTIPRNTSSFSIANNVLMKIVREK